MVDHSEHSAPISPGSDNNLSDPASSTYQASLLKQVVNGVRASSHLPKGYDFKFFAGGGGIQRDAERAENDNLKSNSLTFLNRMKIIQKRLLSHLDLLIQREIPSSLRISNQSSAIDDDDRMDIVSAASDAVLEKADAVLDQIETSSSTDGSSFAAAATAKAAATFSARETMKRRVTQEHASSNIRRPQLSFIDVIDNSRSKCFVPKIKSKPHALQPLKLELDGNPDRDEDSVEVSAAFSISYKHPYGLELDKFVPCESQLQCPREAKESPSLDNTRCTWIEEENLFCDMIKTLSSEKEVAIDLEAHSYRSFLGFVCLMQVSTRHEDFLVDTLALRSKIHLINEITTDPKIVKVLHGADSDIVWLQRDFGVYVVNMFDTGQASRVLQYPRFSLAYLLNRFCHVDADKAQQLADWRVRPLGKAMMQYAREDTHYLLYIYDKLRQELMDKSNAQGNLLKSVIDRSTDVCRRRFEKPFCDEVGARILCDKYKRNLSTIQREVFKALYFWRDSLAREEDESTAYILPNHMAFKICETLPRETTQILACCNPVPPAVRMNVHEILNVVKSAQKTASERNPMLPIENKDANSVPEVNTEKGRKSEGKLGNLSHQINHEDAVMRLKEAIEWSPVSMASPSTVGKFLFENVNESSEIPLQIKFQCENVRATFQSTELILRIKNAPFSIKSNNNSTTIAKTEDTTQNNHGKISNDKRSAQISEIKNSEYKTDVYTLSQMGKKNCKRQKISLGEKSNDDFLQWVNDGQAKRKGFVCSTVKPFDFNKAGKKRLLEKRSEPKEYFSRSKVYQTKA